MARHWVAQGARRLHLVDLDAARDGQGANAGAVRAILAAVNVPCQLGGGIRDEATIERWLDAGVARLVVGTKAVKEPQWLRDMARRYPARLVLGVDARDGWVATDGWRETSRLAATDLARQFAEEPLAAVVYTDIATDGMMAGPNVAAMAEMQRAVPLPVVASGGVASAGDVARLAGVPMAGCIIGRALYEGALTLPDALAAAGETAPGPAG